MAGRKFQNKRKSQKKSKALRRYRRPRAATQSGLGRVIASGVKSLVATIPVVGDTLKNVADIAFKHFGFTTKDITLTKGSSFSAVETKQLALVSRFWLTPATILAGSKGCIQVDMGRKIMSQYCEGKVRVVTIRVNPSGQLAKLQGDWHLSLQPFFSDDSDHEPGIASSWLPTEQGIHHSYLSTTGKASTPLQITYRPRIADGRAFMFQDLASAFAEVNIRYDCMTRSDYSEFSANDIGFDIKISGTVETRTTSTMPSNQYGGYLFATTVDDKLKDVAAFIANPAKKWIISVQNTDYSCTSDNGLCKVTGKILDVRESSISLADKMDFMIV